MVSLFHHWYTTRAMFKDPSLSNYLLVVRVRIVRLITFSIVVVLSEMQMDNP